MQSAVNVLNEQKSFMLNFLHLHHHSTRLRNIWNPTSFNCLSPAFRACDYVYIDCVRCCRSSSCRLLRPIYCQTYITFLWSDIVGWHHERDLDCNYTGTLGCSCFIALLVQEHWLPIWHSGNMFFWIGLVTLQQGPVSAWIGDRLWTAKPPQCRTRHVGLLSLSHPCVNRQNEYTAKSGGVNRHIAWYTSSYLWSCSGWTASLTEIGADVWDSVAHCVCDKTLYKCTFTLLNLRLIQENGH